MPYIKKYSSAESSRSFEGNSRFRYEYSLKYIQGKSVLDLGSGYSLGASFLAEHGAKSVDAVDYSEKVINIANNLYHVPNLRYHWMNVLDIVSLNKKYDVIIAFELIEHLPVPDQAKFLNVITQVLKPSGILLITTPNKYFASKGRKTPHNPFHTREFNYRELKEIMPGEYKSVKIYGVVCTNQKFTSSVKIITSKKKYAFISLLERISWIHDLLPYIPKKIKDIVTGLGSLPPVSATDFSLVETNQDKCESFYLVAKLVSTNLKTSKKP